MSKPNNILPNEGINNNELLKYVTNTLTDTERATIDAQIAEDAFAQDAVQGLQAFANTPSIANHVAELNNHLVKQTRANKSRKSRRPLPSNLWIIIGISIVLSLAVLGYGIIYLLQHK